MRRNDDLLSEVREPWPLRWSRGLAQLGAASLLLLLVVFSFALLGLVHVLEGWSKRYAA